MEFYKLLLICIPIICTTSLNFGQSKKIKLPPLVVTNDIQRLVNNEKVLNNRIAFLENDLKQLKQKQTDLRIKINDQIENEIKQITEMKEKCSSEDKKMKSAKEKKAKIYIEKSEERLRNLKKLQEELKSNWKDN